MNGAGNRFVIYDARGDAAFTLTSEQVKVICAKNSSISGPKGADQLMIMRAPKNVGADLFMEIWNCDGGEVNACGNATRCVAWLYLREIEGNKAVLQTNADLLYCQQTGPFEMSVDMGEPKLDWAQIPLAEPMHTHAIDVKVGPIDDPVLFNPGAVSMGNPHCVFFVEDFERARPEKVGPMIEFHPLFPEQVNVGFARIDAKDKIRLRVWERGAGLTLACGTGACAAVVAAVRQNHTGRHVTVIVDGGVLDIHWRESDNHVIMTGPVEMEFDPNHNA